MSNYVCDQSTHKVLFGPLSSNEAVAWIMARGSIGEQAKYCNMSRYLLEKNGWYPMNRAGNARLEEDVRNGTPEHLVTIQQARRFIEKHMQSGYSHCGLKDTDLVWSYEPLPSEQFDTVGSVNLFGGALGVVIRYLELGEVKQ